MIEWVKGHEKMADSQHTWASKMNQLGNEWADETAKAALEVTEED